MPPFHRLSNLLTYLSLSFSLPQSQHRGIIITAVRLGRGGGAPSASLCIPFPTLTRDRWPTLLRPGPQSLSACRPSTESRPRMMMMMVMGWTTDDDGPVNRRLTGRKQGRREKRKEKKIKRPPSSPTGTYISSRRRSNATSVVALPFWPSFPGFLDLPSFPSCPGIDHHHHHHHHLPRQKSNSPRKISGSTPMTTFSARSRRPIWVKTRRRVS